MSELESNLPKVIVLLGPTASGKTQWGLKLAKEFDGEIISADSRQIYKKMDIGTAKELGEWKSIDGCHAYYIDGIPHHLVDWLDPGKTCTVAEWRDKALQVITDCVKRNRVPFVVGGTGLYITSLVDNWLIPRLAPNAKLRRSLEQKKPTELVRLLKKMDPESAARIDPKNVRRLIRALEVCILSGEPFSAQRKQGPLLVAALQIGIVVPREELGRRIDTRVDTMVERGLEQEVRKLLQQKYSWKLPSMSGIGYRQWCEYIEGNIALPVVIARLKHDSRDFARRQMTWWRRDKRIQWVNEYEEGRELVKDFVSGIAA